MDFYSPILCRCYSIHHCQGHSAADVTPPQLVGDGGVQTHFVVGPHSQDNATGCLKGSLQLGRVGAELWNMEEQQLQETTTDIVYS